MCIPLLLKLSNLKKLKMLLRFSKLLFFAFCVTKIAGIEFKYHKYAELQSIFKNLTESYTKVSMKLNSIGKSVQGRELWVVEIIPKNDAPAFGIPSVKLVGNIHGNEAVGREMLLHFLKYLGDNYGVNAEITWLLNNTKIYVLPSMNPDGFEMSNEGTCSGEHGRLNAKKFDLNRNFPAVFHTNLYPKQPETRAVEDWMKKIYFILSVSLHGGSLVVNYPFDSVKEEKWEKLIRELGKVKDLREQQKLREDYIASLPRNPPSLSPDDDVFKHLAHTYADKHPTMHQGLGCSSAENFTDGITNGAAWYPFQGGMQDFNYFMHGCMELTMEISCCKYPRAGKLQQFWEENRDALVEIIKQAHRGVSGKIVDNSTGRPINNANLRVIGRDMNFTASSNGEFWRLLLPGNYSLQINAQGYHQQILKFSVLDYGKKQPELTKLEIRLINDTYPITILTTVPSTSTTVSKENLTDDGKVWLNSLDENLYDKNYSGFIREQIQNDDVPRQARIAIPDQMQSSCSSQIYNIKIVLFNFYLLLRFLQ